MHAHSRKRNGHAVAGVDDALGEHLDIHLSFQLAVRCELTQQDAMVLARDVVGDVRSVQDEHRSPNGIGHDDIPSSLKIGFPVVVRIANGQRLALILRWRTVKTNGQPTVEGHVGIKRKKRRIHLGTEHFTRDGILVKRRAGSNEKRQLIVPVHGADDVVVMGGRQVHSIGRQPRQVSFAVRRVHLYDQSVGLAGFRQCRSRDHDNTHQA